MSQEKTNENETNPSKKKKQTQQQPLFPFPQQQKKTDHPITESKTRLLEISSNYWQIDTYTSVVDVDDVGCVSQLVPENTSGQGE